MSKYVSHDIPDLFEGTPHAPRCVLSRRVRRRIDRDVRRREIPMPKPKNPPVHFERIPCPCCGKEIGVPSFEVLVDYYDVPPMERKILSAVWRGKGMPVSTERIFDAMYADDPDGGPDPTKMYKALKVGLSRLNARLKGSGVSVENVGYRQGYRLKLGETNGSNKSP